jgi:hypothetical protein
VPALHLAAVARMRRSVDAHLGCARGAHQES